MSQSQELALVISLAVNIGLFLVNFIQARTNRSTLRVIKSQQAVSLTPTAEFVKKDRLVLRMKNAGPGVVSSMKGSYWHAIMDSHHRSFEPLSAEFETGAIGVGETVTAIPLGDFKDLIEEGNALRVYWGARNVLGDTFRGIQYLSLEELADHVGR